ncbi:hypothetical protein SRHO_G00215100 [Serrasalmus rhombeus]
MESSTNPDKLIFSLCRNSSASSPHAEAEKKWGLLNPTATVQLTASSAATRHMLSICTGAPPRLREPTSF